MGLLPGRTSALGHSCARRPGPHARPALARWARSSCSTVAASRRQPARRRGAALGPGIRRGRLLAALPGRQRSSPRRWRTPWPTRSSACSRASPGPFLSRIAFVSDRTGAKELWVMRWDGTDAQQLTSHKSIAMSPAWSADGQWLAFMSFMRGQPQLFILKPTQGFLRPLSTMPGVNTSAELLPRRRAGRLRGRRRRQHRHLRRRRGRRRAAAAHQLAGDRHAAGVVAERPADRLHLDRRPGRRSSTPIDAEGSNLRRLTFDGQVRRRGGVGAGRGADRLHDVGRQPLPDRHAGPAHQHPRGDRRPGQQRVAVLVAGRHDAGLRLEPHRLASRSSSPTPLGNPQQLTSDGNNMQPSWVAQVQ